MSSTPEPIAEATARELALAALHEITPDATIGEYRDSSVDADGVLTLRFANRMPGYPGWFWTVSVAQVEDSAPTVLEAELMPGEGALTAPDWLPWAERLAEYQAAQAALAAEGLETDDLAIGDDDEEELDDELDDVDDLDASDFDADGSPILHAGDVDGVDIDVLSDDAEESEDSEESDDSDDSADAEESEDSADAEDADDAGESEDAEDSDDAGESEDAEDSDESEDAEDSDESEDAEDSDESEDSADSDEFADAEGADSSDS